MFFYSVSLILRYFLIVWVHEVLFWPKEWYFSLLCSFNRWQRSCISPLVTWLNLRCCKFNMRRCYSSKDRLYPQGWFLFFHWFHQNVEILFSMRIPVFTLHVFFEYICHLAFLNVKTRAAFCNAFCALDFLNTYNCWGFS